MKKRNRSQNLLDQLRNAYETGASSGDTLEIIRAAFRNNAELTEDDAILHLRFLTKELDHIDLLSGVAVTSLQTHRVLGNPQGAWFSKPETLRGCGTPLLRSSPRSNKLPVS